MRAGEEGNATFQRTDENGDQEEVYMAFAPVEAWTLQPVNSSDFSQGVTAETTLVYSVGFGITISDLQLPFKQVEDEVKSDIRQGNYISFALIIAAFMGVIHMTYTMVRRLLVCQLSLLLLSKTYLSRINSVSVHLAANSCLDRYREEHREQTAARRTPQT